MPQETKASSCGCSHHDPVPSGAACACGQAHEESAGCKCQGLNIYRRFHSLAAIIFGAFLIIHLIIAASALSPERFNQNGAALNTLKRNLSFIDIVFISLPLLILASTGSFLLYKSGLSYNVKKCNRGGKFRYFLQRLSAVITLVFIIAHLYSFGRIAVRPAFNPDHPYLSTLNQLVVPDEVCQMLHTLGDYDSCVVSHRLDFPPLLPATRWRANSAGMGNAWTHAR